MHFCKRLTSIDVIYGICHAIIWFWYGLTKLIEEIIMSQVNIVLSNDELINIEKDLRWQEKALHLLRY